MIVVKPPSREKNTYKLPICMSDDRTILIVGRQILKLWKIDIKDGAIYRDLNGIKFPTTSYNTTMTNGEMFRMCEDMIQDAQLSNLEFDHTKTRTYNSKGEFLRRDFSLLK